MNRPALSCTIDYQRLKMNQYILPSVFLQHLGKIKKIK